MPEHPWEYAPAPESPEIAGLRPSSRLRRTAQRCPRTLRSKNRLPADSLPTSPGTYVAPPDTGVLGPHSNAHGPNEFLHVEYAKKLTACVSLVLADHARTLQVAESA